MLYELGEGSKLPAAPSVFSLHLLETKGYDADIPRAREIVGCVWRSSDVYEPP